MNTRAQYPDAPSAPGRTATQTVLQSEPEPSASNSPQPSTTIRLTKPKRKKRVEWTSDTVDNEGMNKKSSKCCCIYEKPRAFGESSSESEDEDCEHCRGHVEKKRTPSATTQQR
ncbi:E3 ubiquitin-protein ligase PPP1R11, partial [Fragariocoptes setiger]